MARSLVAGEPFLRGVNLPWLSYGSDFGGNAWHPHGNLDRADTRRQLAAVFARLAAARVHLLRWFLLCDGRAGLCEDDDGQLAGLDDCTFGNFGNAVTLAEAHGVALVPVLLDFHWCSPPRDVEGVRCGGRAHQLVDSGHRARLLHHVIRPLLSRFGGREGIAAWDLVNEPEWVTFSWRSWDPLRAVLPDAMADFIAEGAALVHECTDHPATVGLASAASVSLVRGLGLDCLQVHWYERFAAECPLEAPVTTWSPDVPVLLGEFPTSAASISPREVEQRARASGYAGALAWSLQANDAASDADRTWRWLEGEDRPTP